MSREKNKNVGKSNIDKMHDVELSVNKDSQVSKLGIKIYYEQIIRYYGTELEKDTIHKYITQLFELRSKRNEVEGILKAEKEKKSPDSKLIEDNEKELTELEGKADSVMEEKRSYLKSVISSTDYLTRFWDNLEHIDSAMFEVYGILHNMDTVPIDFFNSKDDEHHLHIGIRSLTMSYKTASVAKRYPISYLLRLLHIEFDPELDKGIVDHDAVAYVYYWCNYVYYLCHDDDNSESEGKYHYDRSCVHMNVTEDKYNDTLRGVLTCRKRKVSTSDIAEYRQQIIELASMGRSSDSVMRSVFVEEDARDLIYTNDNLEKAFNKHYKRGIDLWIANNPTFYKRCIFIYGKGEIGKSRALASTIASLGYRPEEIFIPKGTDNTLYMGLELTHKVAVFDDIDAKMVLKVCDDRPCTPRVLFGFAFAALELVIICTNEKPLDYFSYYKDSAKYEPTLSRLAVFKVEDADGSVTFEKPMTRGSRNDRIYEDKNYCLDFIHKFETYTKAYCENISIPPEVCLMTNDRTEGVALMRYRSFKTIPGAWQSGTANLTDTQFLDRMRRFRSATEELLECLDEGETIENLSYADLVYDSACFFREHPDLAGGIDVLTC